MKVIDNRTEMMYVRK